MKNLHMYQSLNSDGTLDSCEPFTRGELNPEEQMEMKTSRIESSISGLPRIPYPPKKNTYHFGTRTSFDILSLVRPRVSHSSTFKNGIYTIKCETYQHIFFEDVPKIQIYHGYGLLI